MQQEWTPFKVLHSTEFKRQVTSGKGQPEVKEISPKPKKDKCKLVGQANEVEILVNGHCCLALLDTGSMVTTVSKSFYEAFLEKEGALQSLDTLLLIQGAGGHHLPYLGYVEVSISVAGCTEDVEVPVLVVEPTLYNEKVPVIVGTNVIASVKGTPQQAAWKLATENLAKSDDESGSSCNVYSVGNVVVPANSTFVISARLGIARDQGSGIICGGESLPGGLILPEAVVEANHANRVKVQVFNFSDKAIEIPRRQKIADFQQGSVLAGVMTAAHEQGPEQGPGQKQEERKLKLDFSDTELTEEEISVTEDMIERWKDVFASGPQELGTARGVQHRINLENETPFRERHHRIPPGRYDEVREHLRDMLACGAIRHSNSPWSSNVVLVKKKDGSLRFCVDYSSLTRVPSETPISYLGLTRLLIR